MVQLWTLGLTLALRLLPILYSWKLIRSEAELKRLQEQFTRAISEAEKGVLDAVKLRDAHAGNVARLKQRWDTIKASGTALRSDK